MRKIITIVRHIVDIGIKRFSGLFSKEVIGRTYWPRCPKCGDDSGILVRGLCLKCDPRLHMKQEAERIHWNKIFEQYIAETGKEPLANWNEFEDWHDNKTDTPEKM